MEITDYHSEYKEDILFIFQSRPDIFPENELESISLALDTESTGDHLKTVAVEGGTLVGYIGAIKLKDSNASWHLDYFSVHPEYKRLGIGKSLLLNIEKMIRELGARNLYIETCSCKGESVARNFYATQGYIQEAVLKDYYSEGHSKIFYNKVIVY